MATIRRDHAADARYFDHIAQNRAAVPDTTRLADILSALAETQDGDKHTQLLTFAVTVQEYADKGESITTDEALTAMTMALRVLGLLKKGD